MDRKAWIVTSICTLGMLYYMFVYMPEYRRYQRDLADKRLIEEEAEKEKNKEKEQGDKVAGDTEEGDTPKPPNGEEGSTPTPEVPVVEEVPEELVTLETTDADGEAAAVFTLTNKGGGISEVKLIQHTTNYDPKVPITLNGYSDHPIGTLSRGHSEFENNSFTVVSKSDSEVVFETTTREMLKVQKKYTLVDPSLPGAPYRINLEISFTNVDPSRRYSANDYYLYAGSIAALKPMEFMQPDYSSMLFKEGDKYRNRDVRYLGKSKHSEYNPQVNSLMWAGPMNQYFVQNIAAAKSYNANVWAERFSIDNLEGYTAEESEKHYAVHGAIGMPKLVLDVGSEPVVQQYELYLGPKTLKELREMGKDRERIMRYNIIPILGGMAAPVSKFLMGILLWIQGMVHNYGVAILIMTVLLRTALWPIYAKSQKTMKRMSKLSPKMTALREKYRDNPQKMQQETAKLFRENGMGPLGPLGGCLPMLVQIPIFLGFFQMLRLAVELRHEPFMAWVTDLSMPDTLFTVPGIGLPINILPLLMAATMIWQMKVTPSSGDPMQRKLMMIMPIIFLVFCYNFASALALYWTGQNLFSIGQTYLTRNKDDDEPVKEAEPTPKEIAKKRAAAKGGPRTGGAGAKRKKKK